MSNEQKERLEQELRFLKESLEADVISRDEYERGKERIEGKLKEITPGATKEAEEEIEKGIEIKEINEHTNFTEAGETESREMEPAEGEMPEEKQDIATQEGDPDDIPGESEKGEPEEEIEISKKWFYVVGIILIAFILFFAVRSCKSPETSEEGQIGKVLSEETNEVEFIPECSKNSDCRKEGHISVCKNPGAKDAKCEFELDTETNLIVVNDKGCKLCSTSNTITIVKEIFPNAKIREIDLISEEAQTLVNELGIDALPAYIFDSDVQETANFNDFTALRKKGSSYLITNTASGGVYYLKRPLAKNKLDLYVLPDTDRGVESNVQEVLSLFNGKLDFTKHVVTEKEKKVLEAELAINTYPTFLLNNQLKFRGILPANTIKEKICSVNYFEECKKELSKI